VHHLVADGQDLIGAGERGRCRRLVPDGVLTDRPAHFAGLLVEPGVAATVVTAGLDEQDVAEHDRGGRETVSRGPGADDVRCVDAPDLLAVGEVDRDQLTERAERVDAFAVYGRHGQRAIGRTVMTLVGVADPVTPDLLSACRIERDQEVRLAVGKHRHRAAAGDRDAGVPGADRRGPLELESDRLGVERAAALEHSGPVGTAPVRPIGREDRACTQQDDGHLRYGGGKALSIHR